MNDLVDSTAFLIAQRREDDWVTATSVLRATSASLRLAASAENTPAFEEAANWIEHQLDQFFFATLELTSAARPVMSLSTKAVYDQYQCNE